ncbi:PH domain-containing protein [Bradyrhizobium sp. 31Argb]|uniref:PH domain-containing protein n=1 Tax=unclassified Bradyrhizobium TaxID=2631580 RepID=UPI00249DE1D4|nr:PH domain-containing protein [Bradyrhizobium sp. Arg237L]MDI4237087.1 PH domain-containing protein [Bradyrhizobium sp. Arg237L]
MGRYIDEILQPGERVLYSTNAHWIFFLPAIAGWVVAIVFLVLSYMVPTGAPAVLCLVMAALAAIAALYKTVTAGIHHWTTETDVTNLRVVHKTGFIRRKTIEMSLDKIASVNVEQSILGRILNYGDVTIFSVGEAEQDIPTIASPLAFRNSITAR